jgi:hypothetical protein
MAQFTVTLGLIGHKIAPEAFKLVVAIQSGPSGMNRYIDGSEGQ